MTELFVKDGKQGEEWLQANMSFPQSSMPYRILIETQQIDGVTGDISVDDLEFLIGECDGKIYEQPLIQILNTFPVHTTIGTFKTPLLQYHD